MQTSAKDHIWVTQEELIIQQEKYAQNALLLKERMGHRAKVLVKTFGCQGNVADSEKILGIFLTMGCEEAVCEEEADIVIFNTCAVRENAQTRLLSMVGELKHLKEKNPSVLLGLCGCMMQQAQVVQKIKHTYPFIELVFGTHVMHMLPQMINDLLTKNSRVFNCYEGENRENRIAEGLPAKRTTGVQASLQIMYGCDNFCSYCIVPYVRGREVSRKPEDILREAKEILAQGYKEILLLGQNVNSYGKGLEEDINFTQLLSQIDALPGKFRIRFMTSHPKDCTKELIDLIAGSKKICHNIHLPVQSGSNRILQLMNRRYTREHYLELIRYAKEKMPDVTFTSDIIVGFPGETYEDFLETKSLCEQVRYQALYTFVYSPRPGTKALELDDPVPYQEKTKWLNELVDLQHHISEQDNKAAEGTVLEALVEHPAQKKEGCMIGRCENGINVCFPAQGVKAGDFVKVHITKGHRAEYEGELL